MTTSFRNGSMVYVCSAARAARLTMSMNTSGDIDAIISIADPSAGKRPPREGLHSIPHRLLLSFDDVLKDDPAYTSPTIADVERIIAFDRALRGRVRPGKRLLIHCHAGISRSAAAALAILADRCGPGREAESIELLKVATEDGKPLPNSLMMAFADELLGRDGALREAAGKLYRLGALLAGQVSDAG